MEDGVMVWDEPPGFLKAKPGDPIPREWDTSGPFDTETGEQCSEELDEPDEFVYQISQNNGPWLTVPRRQYISAERQVYQHDTRGNLPREFGTYGFSGQPFGEIVTIRGRIEPPS